MTVDQFDTMNIPMKVQYIIVYTINNVYVHMCTYMYIYVHILRYTDIFIYRCIVYMFKSNM